MAFVNPKRVKVEYESLIQSDNDRAEIKFEF